MTHPPLRSAALVVAVAMLTGCEPTAFGHPAMPAIEVSVTSAPPDARLTILYDDQGVDPMADGPGRATWHIDTCTVTERRCVTTAKRGEIEGGDAHYRTIQVRLFGPSGNPIVGGVRWDGRAPQQVFLRCDFTKPAKRACSIISAPA